MDPRVELLARTLRSHTASRKGWDQARESRKAWWRTQAASLLHDLDALHVSDPTRARSSIRGSMGCPLYAALWWWPAMRWRAPADRRVRCTPRRAASA